MLALFCIRLTYPMFARTLQTYSTIFMIVAIVLSTFTVAVPVQAAMPVLSGGGPPNGQTNVPLEAFIDISSSVALNPASVSSSTVTLYSCTGETDASACDSPVVATNLCGTVNLENSGMRIVCITSTPLSTSTTYRFSVLGGGSGIAALSDGATMASDVTRIFRTGSVDSSSNTTLPQVMVGMPMMSASTNSPITFAYSFNPASSMLADGSANAVNNANNIRVRTVTNGVFGSDICTTGSCGTITYTSAARTLTVSGLSLSANTSYDVCQLGNVVNTSVVAMGGDYCFGFTTSAGADSTGPAPGDVIYDPVNGATDVSRFLDHLAVDFPEALNGSTATLSNIRIYPDADANSAITEGETPLGSSQLVIGIDPNGRDVDLGLLQPLAASTRYCYNVTTGVQDSAGNALSGEVQNICFTTGSTADSTGPTVLYADGDTFSVVAAFSEAVNQTAATTPGNYTLECSSDGTNFTGVSLTGKTITYDSGRREIEISGLGLTPGQQCRVTVTGVVDLAGNAITTAGGANIAQFMVLDSAVTGGFLGGSGATQDFATGTDFASFWMTPEICEPATRRTSASSAVRCEFPAPAALPIGATFALNFPSGFDVTNAQAQPNAFDNNDLNGPATGAPTMASVVADAAARTVVVTTGTAAIASGDRIRFALNQVTNPSTAQTDKRITVIVKNALGVKQGQTINPTPFSISEGGSRTISGTVFKDTDADNIADAGEGLPSVTVFCDQFGAFGGSGGSAGHQEATTNGSGVWSITGLFDGEYGCGMPPLDFGDEAFADLVTSGSSFRNVSVDGGNVTGIDFKFTDGATDATVQTLSITISGKNDGASGADADADVDIFCHAVDYEFSAPTMKAVDFATSGSTSATLKLKGGKTYECGLGPHMDFSTFSTGGPPPVPVFDFMPPVPQQVVVPTDSAPSAVTFALESAEYTITGTVQDGSANGIANVFVDAFPLGCFDATTGADKACHGAFAQSKSDGTYTLNVASGQYEVRAFAPGMPESEGVSVTVTDACRVSS